MCGLAGTSFYCPDTHRFLEFASYHMEDRGDDSWGLTNGRRSVRRVGPVSGGFHVPEWVGEGDAVAVHTRAASVGSVTEENQHPFEVVGDKVGVLGMHNGAIRNHFELKGKWGVDYPVDSQYLMHALAHNKPLTELHGWGAVVWWCWLTDKADGPRQLMFMRFNTEALHIAKVLLPQEGEGMPPVQALVWASTEEALCRASRIADLDVKFHYKVKANTLYRYGADYVFDEGQEGFPLLLGGKVEVGGMNPPYKSSASSASSASVYGWQKRESPPSDRPSRDEYVSSYSGQGGSGCNASPKVSGLGSSSRWVSGVMSIGAIGQATRDAKVCMRCEQQTTTRAWSPVCMVCENELKSVYGKLGAAYREPTVYGVDDTTFDTPIWKIHIRSIPNAK